MRVGPASSIAKASVKTLVSRRIASYSGRVNGTSFIRAGVCRPLQLHGKQLARAPHRIDAKKEDVVDREDDGDEPEAECDRRDDGEGGEGRAAERAERVEDVARQVIDESGAASVATLVGGKRHRAEARERPGASVGGAQTGGDVLLRLALDVERELLVELAFDAAAEPSARESAGTRSRRFMTVTPASSRGRWPWTCAPRSGTVCRVMVSTDDTNAGCCRLSTPKRSIELAVTVAGREPLLAQPGDIFGRGIPKNRLYSLLNCEGLR